MAAKKKIINGSVWIAFLALAFPMLYAFVKTDNKPNLTGIVISDKKPELNSANWASGVYQSEMDDYNNDHWSLKEASVRLKQSILL